MREEGPENAPFAGKTMVYTAPSGMVESRTENLLAQGGTTVKKVLKIILIVLLVKAKGACAK